jgi:FtsH-binding integral membrane protein
MPTFLKRFRRNLPSNFEEWLTSIMVLAIGMLWLVFPASFVRDDMRVFLEIASPRIWTTTMIMVGLLSCVGMAAITEAPRVAGLLRSIMNIVRVGIFGAFLGRSFASSDWQSVSLGVVLWSAFILLDGRNIFFRSWPETYNAFRKVRPIVQYTSVVR